MQSESGIVPDFEVGEEFHEEPKTYYELKSQPLKNRLFHHDSLLIGRRCDPNLDEADGSGRHEVKINIINIEVQANTSDAVARHASVRAATSPSDHPSQECCCGSGTTLEGWGPIFFWYRKCLTFGLMAGSGSTLAPKGGVGGSLPYLFERCKKEDLEHGGGAGNGSFAFDWAIFFMALSAKSVAECSFLKAAESGPSLSSVCSILAWKAWRRP
ncbi:microphthalmia-associated transcription factor [Labeo rohita]|uniref:Microphthalmia-associated transcription factor n=1 Tax=Labeo rohita TaxID=84645 RepID=A0A498N944_LABRO|nr:microphthalmia-associated transcription factor [Labeo rohita]